MSWLDRAADNMSITANKWMEDNGGPDSWIDIPMVILARAALTAMREPTPEMIEAGLAAGRGPFYMWQAMIDAALAEKVAK